ncbi:uncharacterized protein LOC122638332 [Telopea speciosissima]|uniref:uncharacterized protein LOC122638332 n=1 Tax=Telopea speciosissima TaxID=54955 RepID=UPI001CC44FA6|nr:uncharacterized protein LOC122638332 [Telopea speciosissima]
MHGREGEERKRRRHMWPVPALGTTTVVSDSTTSSTADHFCKDGRKISVGDCALFKPPQESPPFIGIIRWLTSGKEDNLKLGVNWLYRPAEVKLGKGILLEAAPNEVFYSFHKDEIPAASLLHPCKVAFLRKGVELPSGISSFVCRRVYDIADKCLWWLTDQDYINERQEEVDQLLDKTRLEMHAAVQSGGRSPKPLNGPTSTPPIKTGSDSVQNSVTSFPSQGKGKKRERGDQGSEPIKRERSLKTDDVDSGHFRLENMLKSEIAKITDKGGLVDLEGVEKFVQLMQPDRSEKKIDMAGRIMLADVIAATDRFDCLGCFVQLRGLPVLDQWLQEVHKGKIGDGNSSKEGDKSVEEFLLALLRALDKLPVNLHALQTCNVGKSVNNLRSHKNLEIQKKARSLVDTWKKRVEAEMKINDAKTGSAHAVSWPSKPGFSEVSHGGSRRTGGSSEVAVKSSITQPSASKSAQVKIGHGDAFSKSTPVSPGSVKLSTSFPAPVATGSKDSHCKMAVSGGASDPPLSTIKEEKSSSSSQSQNNSQSCSSDHAKTVGSSCREDARSSTAGSMSVNKASNAASRHWKSSNGFLGSAASGVQKETAVGKCSSMTRNTTSEKVSQSGLTCERAPDTPIGDHGGSHRLIVRIPNPGRSPARSASGGSFDDPSIIVSRVSSPGNSEKHDNYDRKVKGKNDACRANIVADVNTESSWQSNDVKDGVVASDEGDGSPAAAPDEQCRNTDEIAKTTDVSKCSSSGNNPKTGKLYEASFSSMNALVESCVKYSEASTSMVGDDLGMNLLASVATGEMSKSDLVSPIGSPRGSSPSQEDSFMSNGAKFKLSHEDAGPRSQVQPDESADDDTEKQGDSKITCSDEKVTGERIEQLQAPGKGLQQSGDLCSISDGRPDDNIGSASLTVCTPEARADGVEDEGGNQLRERKKSAVPGVHDGLSDIKLKTRSPLLDEKKKVDHVEGKIASSSIAEASDFVHGSVVDACNTDNAVSITKVEKESVDESPSCPSVELDSENKNHVHLGYNAGVANDRRLQGGVDHGAVESSDKDALLPSGLGNVMAPENELQGEKSDEMDVRNHFGQSDSQRKEQTSNGPTFDERGGAVGSVVSDHGNEGNEEKKTSEKREHLETCSVGSAPNEESSPKPAGENDQALKATGSRLTGPEADDVEECMTMQEASSSATAGSDMAAKLDFDLNEGFPVDEGNQSEPVTSAIHLPNHLAFSGPSLPIAVPAQITIASPSKGSFLSPETLLKSKVELGWKGSAVTSAFRPAEPRKVLEMPLGTTDIPPDTTANKQGRPPLDIDLNVPDEKLLEDMASQSSAHETVSESRPANNRDLGLGEMFGSSNAPGRSAGGLDLDLNRVDEGTDAGQFLVSTSCRLEVSVMPAKSLLSSGLPNGEVNVLRDFDLNNGPGIDEVGTEAVPRSQHSKSNLPFLPSVTGFRMNNAELGNLSWFPPGNSYPAVAIPSILPDRGEQPYPIVATSGTQRILGPPTGGTNFGPDMYRGSVLSSSPAVAFSPASPFPYTGFPFGTSFPIPSTSFSGGSPTFVDSSPGGGICFPAVPSQLVGPTGSVTSHYPRPYVISLPDGASNTGAESSRKWRQGLDLNAGPGATDMEGRDDRISSASKQFSVASSQALAEEQVRMYQAAGGVLKRNEPEGGWNAESFSYKQPSWQ